MLKNYLITTLRHLRKHRNYTIINLLGLSLGITCSLILFLMIKFWLSFDTFHTKADRIYRVVKESDGAGGRDFSPGVPLPLPDAFRNDFPETEQVAFVRALFYAGTLLTVEEAQGTPKSFQEEEHVGYTEPQFFEVFDRPFLAGNPATALDEPNEVVLSEKYAKKYFGNSQPVGKTITLNKEKTLVVTGVMQDYPDNTDFPLDVFISYATVKNELKGSWGSTSSDDQCYVLLAEGQSAADINRRLVPFVKKYYGEETAQNDDVKHYLQPLQEMHFDPRFSTFGQTEIPKEILWTLSIVAVFLIFIACVNFINLATATSVKRAKEVGIRKVLGSTFRQLVRQFLGETVLITLLAVLIALGLTELLLLKVNPFLELSLKLQLLHDAWLLYYLVGITIIISVLSGLYPAWVMARFQPAQAFKNHLQKPGKQGFSLRKGLIVFQFIIAQVFIIGTIVLFLQMQYIRQADLGFQHEAVVSVRLPESKADYKKTLQTELQRLPGVEKVSLAYSNPSSGWLSMTSYQMEDNPERYNTQVKYADRHYLDVFEIKLMAGEGFTETDTLSRVLVNETFLRKQGMASPEEAIGKTIKLWEFDLPIVGVVQDFHTQSLTRNIEPTIIIDDRSSYDMAAIRLQPGHTQATLKHIEQKWSAFYPEYTFDYQFVDDEIADFYEGVDKLSKLIHVAALVVIFIGCLGLYGLVTFMAEQKTKEIGIRKVMGASVGSIVRIFSLEFIKLIALAFVVAAPLAYYVMNGWLQDFAFRVNLGAGVFLVGMLVTLLIALLTVSYQSVKSAMANPVESLRNE